MPGTNRSSIAWRISRSPIAMGGARFQINGGQQAVGKDSFLWSLADLMTLLLVFFVMLYSRAATTPLKGPGPVNESQPPATEMVSDYAMDVLSERSLSLPLPDEKAGEADNWHPAVPEPVSTPVEAQQVDESMNRQIITDLEDRFSKDFYVRWEDRQPVIVLGERITFNAGEASLLVEAQDALRRVAMLISNLDDCQVVVTGHTDDRPIHTNAYPSNWELSAARASSVAKVLMDRGVSPGRLVIQGQSQYRPLVPNTTEENRRRNRRVEISLISG